MAFTKKFCLAIIGVAALLCSAASGFVVPPQPKVHRQTTSSLALFEDDDISAVDALLRFGPAPVIIRLTQPQKFWNAVDNYQRKEGCSRLLAVRNMDAYFTDPTGWVMAKDREAKYGEVTDYTKKSGVQKRPVFSTFWAIFVFWFFLSFVPTRIGELGGFNPSALSGGFCTPDVRIIDENGKESFECSKTGPVVLPQSPFDKGNWQKKGPSSL